MTSTNPLFATQWHFALIGDIQTIWAEYDGTGVTVGIYDDGVEAGHEDLAANYNASLDLVDDLGNPLSPLPLAPPDGHGTAVAGIIGAANNGIGGVGVAWGVSLTGVNIDFDNTGVYGSINGPDPAAFRDLLVQGDAFDIVTNSWGGGSFYQPDQSLVGGDQALDEQAWETIAATGRGGLGTIIVKSAGNDNRDANGEGRDASRYTITVAATEADGMAAAYSNFGASILVTAPAAAVTTDLSGDARHPLDEVKVQDYAAPSLVDIDGDGDIDAVVGSINGTLHTYINTGGVFAEVTGAANPFNGLGNLSFSAPTFVDIDGDGDMDAVVGAASGALRTLINTGGTFAEVTGAANPLNGLSVSGYSTPALADIDGDGDLDMVVGALNGTLRTFTTVAGVFTEQTELANPFNGVSFGSASAPSFVDLDGDGDMDVVVGSADGTLRAFQNDGTGAFTELTGAANPFDGIAVDAYSKPSFADIDGDGDADLMVGDWFGRITGYRNEGAGGFVEQTRRGYSATPYTDQFDGTSASAPVVSGVIALMLQAAPGLGWRDVQDILAASARLTGNAFDGGPSPVEDGVWQTNGASTWNGGGYHLHTNYGYGMVDAFNAVRMAKVWHLFGPAQTSANELEVDTGLNDFADIVLPDGTGDGFATTFNMAGNVKIDHVMLDLEFAADSVDDLEVLLTSPIGTVIRAVVPAPQNTGTSTSVVWLFGIEGLRGEMSRGTWTMTAYDRAAGNQITLLSAAVYATGSVASANDTYHFTDEFLTMRGFAADRGTITDTNGGVDWLNFAAVTGNLVLTLGPGQAITVGGVVWATLDGLFEHVVGGDGRDRLIGSDGANRLHGNRGADTIYGLDGTDELHGGAGNDFLDGGAGRDTLFGGAGNDTYVVDTSGDRVFETTTKSSGIDAGGIDTVRSTASFSLNAHAGVQFVENLTLSGTAHINGTGNALANILTGNAGNNVLNGGAGDDTMIGGAGNDTYIVDTAGDRVFETRTLSSTIDAGGIDTVRSAVTFRLDTDAGVRFVEHLVLTGSGNIDATGNALANRLTGNAGDNVLDGGAGDDTMFGGAGNDTYIVDSAGDRVFETMPGGTDPGGTDTVQSAVSFKLASGPGTRFVEHLTLTGSDDIAGTGNALANRLIGNAGHNVLNGGLGNDEMTGGAGRDSFVFSTALGPGNVDRITDFTVADDTIRLDDAVFAGLMAGRLAATAFAANLSGLATDLLDRVIYQTDTGRLFFDADGSAAGATIHFATLSAELGLTHADFIVF